MIKLGRLRLDNFKSFNKPFLTDFSDTDLFIFDGPNGFGKTTIFDAIELCLTGKIGRILETDAKQKNKHLNESCAHNDIKLIVGHLLLVIVQNCAS